MSRLKHYKFEVVCITHTTELLNKNSWCFCIMIVMEYLR